MAIYYRQFSGVFPAPRPPILQSGSGIVPANILALPALAPLQASRKSRMFTIPVPYVSALAPGMTPAVAPVLTPCLVGGATNYSNYPPGPPCTPCSGSSQQIAPDGNSVVYTSQTYDPATGTTTSTTSRCEVVFQSNLEPTVRKMTCAGEKLVFDAIARRIDELGPRPAYPNEGSDSAVTPTMDWAMVARRESDP
jgi:hypothetical protein